MTLPTLAEVERSHIRAVLTHTNGNMARSARILGIDKKTLYRRLKELHPRLLETVRHYRETPPSITEGEG